MRVALCFSGQPRYLDKTVDSWFNNVIRPHNCDVFCHFWKPCNKEEYLDDWSKKKERKWVFDYNKIGMLTPTVLLVEEQKNFRNLLGDIKAHCPIQNTLSMLYSIDQSNKLKSYYEEANNFKYDVVIRARTDTLVKNKLPLEDVKGKIVYLEFRVTSGDQFAYGSSESMDIFSTVYDRIPELLEVHPLHSETYVRTILQHNGIEIKPLLGFGLVG